MCSASAAAAAAGGEIFSGEIQTCDPQPAATDLSSFVEVPARSFPQFSSLPQDLRVRVLGEVDSSTLMKCAVVCREFFHECRNLINTEMVGKRALGLVKALAGPDASAGILCSAVRSCIRLGDIAAARQLFERIKDFSRKERCEVGDVGTLLSLAMFRENVLHSEIFALEEKGECRISSSLEKYLMKAEMHLADGEQAKAEQQLVYFSRALELLARSDGGAVHPDLIMAPLRMSARLLTIGKRELAVKGLEYIAHAFQAGAESKYGFRMEVSAQTFVEFVKCARQPEMEGEGGLSEDVFTKVIDTAFDRIEAKETWSPTPLGEMNFLFDTLSHLYQEGLAEMGDRYRVRLEAFVRKLQGELWWEIPSFFICREVYVRPELAKRVDADLFASTIGKFQGYTRSQALYLAVLKLCKQDVSLDELAASYDSVFQEERLARIFPEPDPTFVFDSVSGTMVPSTPPSRSFFQDMFAKIFFESAISVLKRIPTEARFNQLSELVEERLPYSKDTHFGGDLFEIALHLGQETTEPSARQAYFQRAIKYARSSYNMVLNFMSIARVLRECGLFRSSLDVIDEALSPPSLDVIDEVFTLPPVDISDDDEVLSYETVELKGISPELLHCLLGRITASTLSPEKKLQWLCGVAEALPQPEVVPAENEGGASAAAAAAAGGAS